MAENIVLDREITEKSKSTACKINNSDIRKRVYALNIAANAVENYLKEKDYPVNTNSSLYKIPAFAQDLELADVYACGARLDVRATFDEKIFYIPKIQEKYDAQPCAYIVTKLDSNLDNLQILGFIPANKLDKQQSVSEYYCYETAMLSPISELKAFLQNTKVQNEVPSPEVIEKTKELAVSFVDEELSESEKVYFMKNVIRYQLCREILADMNNFDNVANQISQYEELLNDSTLSILSGNQKEIDEAALANMATVENAEENLEIVETAELDTLENLETADEIEEIEELAEEEPEEVVEELEEEQDSLTIAEEIDETPLDEVEEEIIKPMSVISLQKETEEIESPTEAVAEEDIISDSLLEIEEGIEEELEPENVEELSIDDKIENIEPEIEKETLLEHEDEELSLEEHDSDEILLSEVADLLEEKEEEETEAVSEEIAENEEKTPFVLTLEGEEEEISITEKVVDLEEETEVAEDIEEETSAGIIEEDTAETHEETVEEPAETENKYEEFDLSELDNLSDLTDSTVETDKNSDSQIQNLLDDDLYAILSEENTDDTAVSADLAEETKENAEVAEVAQAENSDEIETLFDAENQNENGEEGQFELAQEPVSAKTVKTAKNMLIGGALLFLLAGGGIISWFMSHSKTADNNTVDATNQDNEMFDLQNNAVVPEDEAPALSQDINKSMTNSFSDKPAAITITKLSWQVSEKLAAENSVKEYLQTAGKNIQINLQNDLANSSDINFNNSIKVSFEIAPDNTMKGMQVLESSGSDQVDEIVLRSIKNTLKYVSVPKLNNFNSDFFLTLIINF